MMQNVITPEAIEILKSINLAAWFGAVELGVLVLVVFIFMISEMNYMKKNP